MNNLLSSKLYNNEDFYKVFERDLRKASECVIIESPFITTRRMNELYPVIARLCKRGIRIVVNTRNPDEHDDEYAAQATQAIGMMQEMGVDILYTVKHHRKLAIIDNDILWEGSLNILSQNDSCEIMRRSVSSYLVTEMKRFIGAMRWI